MYTFNYKTFYDYYSNSSNLITDKADRISLYYFKSSKNPDKKVKPADIGEETCRHIMINGTKLYVTVSTKSYGAKSNSIYFTVPRNAYEERFDDHYHFGICDKNDYKKIIEKDYFIFVERNTSLQRTRKTRGVHSKNKHYQLSDSLEEVHPEPSLDDIKIRINKSLHNTTTKRRVHSKNKHYQLSESLEEVNPKHSLVKIRPNDKYVFFHKTTQHPTGTIIKGKPIGYPEHKYCGFQDNTPIITAKRITCLHEDKDTMGSAFENPDGTLIEEIMRRPFMQTAGRKTRKNRDKLRKNKL